MAYTTIKKPSDYFNTVLYTGDGNTGRSITGVNFQPDWTVIKRRNSAGGHFNFDIIRGATKRIAWNETGAEETNAEGLQSFNSDGFTVGNLGGFNASGDTHVAWNWLASNTTASNTDGSITSTVSANTTSGFSIVSYTGTANSSDTVGHGLGVVPKMIIIKRRDSAGGTNWCVYHVGNNNTKVMFLESTSAGISNVRYWNNTTPTSSVFTIGNDSSLNASGGTFVAYCFAEKQGFSKFGSYTGNENVNGTFIYTGFVPAFVIIKKKDGVTDWLLHDNKRIGYNPNNYYFQTNLSDAEGTATPRIDFLSNGFKIKTTSSAYNSGSGPYMYMAFAEEPLVGDNPATAR